VSATVSELKKLSPDVSVIEFELDVTDERAIDDSLVKTVKEFGRLDYAANCAGIGDLIKTTDGILRDDFEKVMAQSGNASV
jgi:NAD(P)-dependent dehydrogenase (short-subunit alcohol dehydrogenase family)